jgi:hypothetical protein
MLYIVQQGIVLRLGFLAAHLTEFSMTIQSNMFKIGASIALLTLPVALVAQEAAPQTPPAPEASSAPTPTDAVPAAESAAPSEAAPAPEPAASEPIATAAPEPAASPAPAATAQASYPPCSATVTDQCTQGAKRKIVRKTRRN